MNSWPVESAVALERVLPQSRSKKLLSMPKYGCTADYLISVPYGLIALDEKFVHSLNSFSSEATTRERGHLQLASNPVGSAKP
jgi:hypothetical protein